MITIGYSFVGKTHFFVEKYDFLLKKMAKMGTIFLNFFAVFFLFLAKFLCLL